jgi:hypothetical protein
MPSPRFTRDGLLLTLLAAACVLPRMAAAAPPESASRPALPSPLRDDSRLRTAVSLAVKDRPLGEVLTTLGSKVSIRLTASPETADHKVTLQVEKQPLGELLALLARHFRFRWHRTGRDYELRQEVAEKAREGAARQGYRWSLIGPPCAREDYTFNYHLAREEKPARTATLGVLRPAAKESGTPPAPRPG